MGYPRTMQQMHYLGDGKIAIEDAPVPHRGPGEVLVKISASSLCGSERSDLLAGHPSNFGHEASGRIIDIDDNDDFHTGDLVGLYAVLGCGECEWCLRGRETMCLRGPSVVSGWHAEYAVVPLSSLRKVDQTLDASTVALMTGDPLGVPVRSLSRVPSSEETPVVVVGLGPLGLGHVLLRSHLGARVIGIEPSEYRRNLALKLGASEVFAPNEFDGLVDVVIESTGIPSVITSAFDLVATGGTLLQSGECGTPVSLSPSDLFIHREITYTGSWYYASEDFPKMTSLVEDGLPIRSLSTHEVSAHAAQDAVDAFMAGSSGKVVFLW